MKRQERRRTDRIKNHLGFGGKVAFLMAVSLYLYVTMSLFWPYVPIKVHSIEIMNPDKTVIAGENLIYQVMYSKSKTYPVIAVSRQLIDGFILTLAPVAGSSLPLGENLTIKVCVRIPNSADPGTYYMRLSAIYQVNHLRTIVVAADSDKFEIVKNNG